VYKTQNN